MVKSKSTKGYERLLKTRRKNLQQLSLLYGNLSDLARLLGVSVAAVSQIAGSNPVRAISERTAREIETKLGLTPGYLDLDRRTPK